MSVDKSASRGLDRIGAFEITIDGGELISMPTVPFGWYINIKSDSSSSTTVSGQVSVDTNALSIDEIEKSFIIDKYVIDKMPDEHVQLRVSLTVYQIQDSGPGIKHVFDNVSLNPQANK